TRHRLATEGTRPQGRSGARREDRQQASLKARPRPRPAPRRPGGWPRLAGSRPRGKNPPADASLWYAGRYLFFLLPPPPSACRMRALLVRGGAVWQLVGLITRRSQVQILPPLPTNSTFPGLRSSAPAFIVRRAAN